MVAYDSQVGAVHDPIAVMIVAMVDVGTKRDLVPNTRKVEGVDKSVTRIVPCLADRVAKVKDVGCSKPSVFGCENRNLQPGICY